MKIFALELTLESQKVLILGFAHILNFVEALGVGSGGCALMRLTVDLISEDLVGIG